VVMAPVEFDSMGPHWVHWIPGWAQLREKGGETSFHLRRSVNWEIERCCLWPGRHRRYILHGHGDVTPPRRHKKLFGPDRPPWKFIFPPQVNRLLLSSRSGMDANWRCTFQVNESSVRPMNTALSGKLLYI
jgi:hypothetical protein